MQNTKNCEIFHYRKILKKFGGSAITPRVTPILTTPLSLYVSFQTIRTGSGIHRLSLRLSYLRFFIHFSSPAIEFHSCFFFTTYMYISAPIPSILHLLFRWVSRLGTSCGTRCCGPRGRAEMLMKQKSRFKFLPWPGFEPRTLQSDGCERYH